MLQRSDEIRISSKKVIKSISPINSHVGKMTTEDNIEKIE